MAMLWVVWFLSLLLMPFKVLISIGRLFTIKYGKSVNSTAINNLSELNQDTLPLVFEYDQIFKIENPLGLMSLAYNDHSLNKFLLTPPPYVHEDNIALGFILVNLAVQSRTRSKMDCSQLEKQLRVSPVAVYWEPSEHVSIRILSIFDTSSIVKFLAFLGTVDAVHASTFVRLWYKRFRFISLPILNIPMLPFSPANPERSLIETYLFSLAGDVALNGYDYIFERYRTESFWYCSPHSLILSSLERWLTCAISYDDDFLYARYMYILLGRDETELVDMFDSSVGGLIGDTKDTLMTMCGEAVRDRVVQTRIDSTKILREVILAMFRKDRTI